MDSHAVTYALLHRRSTRAFFLARTAQHVESLRTLREVARALAALGALLAWGGVLLLAG
jgi:hypothetical protein